MSVEVDELAPHILRATIHRPEALNAIDFEVMEGLERVLERLESEETWRVFVLRGEGTRAFASGGDLRKFAALETYDDAAEMSSRMGAILSRIEATECWTIASMNGSAYGGGCETALAFDFRLAASNAKLGFTQAKFHVTPGWGGLTRLVELVGRPQAMAWLATAAVISADEAMSAGLLHGVSHDVESATYSLATRLARQSRELIGALKAGGRRAVALPRDEAMAAELEPFATLWAGREHHERVRKFLGDD